MKILDEVKYAEEMIAKGFIQKKYEFELKILAKYYHEKKNLSGDKLKDEIKKFCNSHIKKFNEIKYMRMLKRVIKYGESYSLFVAFPIRITKTEIEKIKNLNDLKSEKVAFTLLVLANINKQSYTTYMKDKIRHIIAENNKRKEPKSYRQLREVFPNISRSYYVNDKIGSIFKVAKIYLKKDERNSILKNLIDKELIVMTKQCKYKVNFIYHNTKETAVILKNFDDFVLEYERLIGDNIGYCECCGKPIRITSNRKKYCEKCWRKINKEQIKQRVNKYRQCNGLEISL